MNFLDESPFKNGQDYWLIADNIKNIYMSPTSLATLLDFERVLDSIDLYAFKNWKLGELVSGPEVGKYQVKCVFMWHKKIIPDPRGARRLKPFDIQIVGKAATIKVPAQIHNPSDFRPGTHKARLVEHPVWLVEITMPKYLMSSVKQGSLELEAKSLDLEELDKIYAAEPDDDQSTEE